MNRRVALGAHLVVAALLASAQPADAQSCGGRWLPGDPPSGFDGSVRAIANWDPDGDGPMGSVLLVGGKFEFPYGGLAAVDPNSQAWSGFGQLNPSSVSSLLTYSNGDIVASGSFTPGTIRKWDNAEKQWQVGFGPAQITNVLKLLPNGDHVAGGDRLPPNTFGNFIARGNPFTGEWLALGGDVNGAVQAVLVLPDGDVIAAGSFTAAGGSPASRIARWNTQTDTWFPMGQGLDNQVFAIAQIPGGDIIVGGIFTMAGNVPTSRIARWSSETGQWSGVGSGVAIAGAVYTLKLLDDGTLLVGGNFSGIGGIATTNIARWNTSTGEWSPLGTGTNFPVWTIEVMDDGRFVVGGDFTTAGGAPASRTAIWDDITQSWSSLGSGFNGRVRALEPFTQAEIVVAGNFTRAPSLPIANVARWNRQADSWAPMGNGIGSPANTQVSALETMPDGTLIAAGNLVRGQAYRWDADAAVWSSFGASFSGTLTQLAAHPNGALYGASVGTLHTTLDLQTWTAIPGRPRSPIGPILVLESGDLLVAGLYNNFMLDPFGYLGRLSIADGTWSTFAGGVQYPASVVALNQLTNGDILVGGGFERVDGVPAQNIARWIASTNSWSPLGPGLSGPAHASLELPNGDLIVTGRFSGAGGVDARNIARWRPADSRWYPVGNGLDDYGSTLMLQADQLIVGGNFANAGGHPSAAFARYQFFDSPPALLLQPQSILIDEGETLILSVTVEPDFEGVTAQWYRNGVPIVDGPAGAAPDGGVVSGATRTFTTPTDTTPITLVISGAKSEDQGDYSVTFTNACGTTTSDVANVRVCPMCPADFDQDGGVTVNDVAAFFADYEHGTPCADLDRDGGLTAADVAAFFLAFEAGGC